MDNFFLVETSDTILVLPIGESQEVKKIYNKIKNTNPELL
jgi:hypothetical protein